MKKLILTGLLAVTSLFAIEDGAYKCISIKFCNKDDICKKLDPHKAPTIVLTVTNNGKVVKDEKDEYKYSETYKTFDIFKNSKFTIAMPTNNVGKNIFNSGIIDNNSNTKVYMACLKK